MSISKNTLQFNRDERAAFVALVRIYSQGSANSADKANYAALIRKLEEGGSLTDLDVFILRMAIEYSSQELREKLNSL